MDPTTPRKRRSPLVRYAPFIVIAVVIVIIAIVAIAGGGNDNGKVTTGTGGNQPPSEVPVQFQAAQQNNTTGNYTWQEHCDTSTGRVAIPVLDPTPCVPKFTGDNGGATFQGVTADTIRIGYYLPKPDPQFDAVLQRAGAYDPPADVEATYKSYVRLFQSQFELYGRKIELVKIQGTGASDDETAAKADASKAAKEDKVFAVVGGPAQASKPFSEELAADHVLCVGTCIVAQPESYYKQHSPYVWTVGPSPDQTNQVMLEFIKKQLAGKNAEWAGDPAFQKEKRTFAFLSYDTNDGQYKTSWDNFVLQLNDAGIPLKLHKNYLLDVRKIPETAHEIAVALKKANATSVIFTGDPIMPSFFTQQATLQNYFPEWIMAGTVFADTSTFGRTFDQRQWEHAFGLQLTPARVPKSKNDAYTAHQWYYGTAPTAENAFQVIMGNVQALFAGLQTAGADLTPDNFRAGMYAIAPPPDAADTIDTVVTFGDHNFWPNPPDTAGLDNVGLLWWNPKAHGEDETGAVGDGMYEFVNGGRRYLLGGWPTEPLPLFQTKGAVTIYDNPPPSLTPKQYPSPAGSPAAAKNG